MTRQTRDSFDALAVLERLEHGYGHEQSHAELLAEACHRITRLEIAMRRVRNLTMQIDAAMADTVAPPLPPPRRKPPASGGTP